MTRTGPLHIQVAVGLLSGVRGMRWCVSFLSSTICDRAHDGANSDFVYGSSLQTASQSVPPTTTTAILTSSCSDSVRIDLTTRSSFEQAGLRAEISIHQPAISILVSPAVARVSSRLMLYADHTSTSFGLPRNVKEEWMKKASWYECPLQKREGVPGREREKTS